MSDAGIFNIRKFLDGKLEHFEGTESYKSIIEELESALEFAESSREGGQQEVIYESKGHIQEEIKDEILAQDERTNYSVEPSFEQSLLSAGFKSDTIAGLKSSIQTVSPNVLLKMDSTLSRTNERTLLRGGSKDGVEQDGR